jgi:hypothetical protein
MAAFFTHDWRRALVEAYTDLFQPAGDPPGTEGWPCCGDGWRDLLERACVRIRAVVQVDGGTLRFTEIKEKYGTTRLYWTGRLSESARSAVEEAVGLAEARSACTCETCGAPGRLYKNGGCFMTACEKHGKGEPVPVRFGLENVHITNRFADGKHVVRARRYIRATDSFEEVDPTILRLDEED